MSHSIAGQVFVVTGGGGAIAQGILRAFAGAGARLVVADRKLDRASAAAEPLGAIPLALDLGSLAGAMKMVREVAERLGPIDGLIHTVGGYAPGQLESDDDAAYDRMLDLNVRPLFHVIRAVIPPMRARGRGFLAAIASQQAWTGSAPGSALYGAAKSALATLLRSLDAELAGTDVAVTVCYPMGAVDTPANRRDMPGIDPRTFIDPEDLAQALLFAATRSPRGRIPEVAVHPRRQP